MRTELEMIELENDECPHKTGVGDVMGSCDAISFLVAAGMFARPGPVHDCAIRNRPPIYMIY